MLMQGLRTEPQKRPNQNPIPGGWKQGTIRHWSIRVQAAGSQESEYPRVCGCTSRPRWAAEEAACDCHHTAAPISMEGVILALRAMSWAPWLLLGVGIGAAEEGAPSWRSGVGVHHEQELSRPVAFRWQTGGSGCVPGRG